MLNSIPVYLGDYDFDKEVDGYDFLKWQNSLGSTTDLAADGNRNMVVDAADLTVWRGDYGLGASALAFAGAATIPEPNTSFLLGIGAFFALRMRVRS